MTSKAYAYIRTRPTGKPFAIKGVDGERPLVQAPNKQRSTNKKAINLYPIGVNEGKSVLYNRLKIEKEAGAAVIHFDSKVCDQTYFNMLTAEKRVLRYSKGFPKYEWHNLAPDKRNEALDTYVYALAALRIVNIDLHVKHNAVNTI